MLQLETLKKQLLLVGSTLRAGPPNAIDSDILQGNFDWSSGVTSSAVTTASGVHPCISAGVTLDGRIEY